jgi:hypothetical protein
MNQIVFLVDVDNTLLDNDHIQADIKAHLERDYGAACRDRYWAILEDLFVELGYRDYLGAAALPRRAPAGHAVVVHVIIPGRLSIRQSSVSAIAGCARTTA